MLNIFWFIHTKIGYVYMLWVPAGIVIELVALKLGFGSVNFGDPLADSLTKYWCALMCATVWTVLLVRSKIFLYFEAFNTIIQYG